jgi:hypothetical protein
MGQQAACTTSSAPGPFYSPRSPILRALFVTLVTGFVLFHRGFYCLFKSKSAAISLPADEANARLARDSIR